MVPVSVQCVHCAICSMQYAVCNMQYAICSMQYAVCNTHCIAHKTVAGHYHFVHLAVRACSEAGSGHQLTDGTADTGAESKVR